MITHIPINYTPTRTRRPYSIHALPSCHFSNTIVLTASLDVVVVVVVVFVGVVVVVAVVVVVVVVVVVSPDNAG